MLPNFLIIGSQKAGTTSIHHVLSTHSQVFMPEKKELNFFFHQEKFRKGIPYYEKCFKNASKEHFAIGEASPGYICHPDVPERIYKIIPDVKLILTERNPVERAYSQYWDNRRHLTEWLSFEEAIKFSLKREYIPGERGYFSRGIYITYIERYLALFPRENLLILQLDELKQEPTQFFRKCSVFLGIDPKAVPEHPGSSNRSYVWGNPLYTMFMHNYRLNKYLPLIIRRLICRGKKIDFKYPPMSEDIRNRLRAFYKPFNERLSAFLEEDLSAW